jgi:hypothetical protein
MTTVADASRTIESEAGQQRQSPFRCDVVIKTWWNDFEKTLLQRAREETR